MAKANGGITYRECDLCGSKRPKSICSGELVNGEVMCLCVGCRQNICSLCGSEEKTDTHHISYLYDITIQVCPECHKKVHYEDGFHDDLKPNLTRKEAKEMGVTHTFIS